MCPSCGKEGFVVNFENGHVAPLDGLNEGAYPCDAAIYSDRVFVSRGQRVNYYSCDAVYMGSFYNREFLYSLTIHRNLLVSTVFDGISFLTMEGIHLRTWRVSTPFYSRVILHNDLSYALHANRRRLNIFSQDGNLVSHWQPKGSGLYWRFALHGNYVYLDARDQCLVGDLRAPGTVSSWPFPDVYPQHDLGFYNGMLVVVGERVYLLK